MGGRRLSVRRLWARVEGSKIGIGGVAFFIANGATGLANFLFNVVISRMLGPSQYGALGALLNLVLILSVLLSGLQVAVTTAVAGMESSVGELGVSHLVKHFLGVGVVLSVGLTAISPLIRSYLHLQSDTSVLILVGWCIPSVLIALFQGILIGEHRFGWVAGATLVSTVVGRLLLGVLFVELGFGLNGAIAATTVAQVLSLLVFVAPLRGQLWQVATKSVRRVSLSVREVALSTLALAGFWVLASMDTVLARHFLPATESGHYTAASVAGRIALFATGSIATLALPRLSLGSGRSAEARVALRWSLVVTFVMGLVVALVLSAIPGFIIRVLFGASYVSAVPALRVLSFEALTLGMLSLLVYYHIARRSLFALLPWLGVLLSFLGIYIFHKTLLSVSLDMLVSLVVIAAVAMIGAVHGLLAEPLPIDAVIDIRQPHDNESEFAQGEIDLSVVVPFYNPGPALLRHLEELVEVLNAKQVSFEIIAVSDGSTDGSIDLVRSASFKSVRVLSLARNVGKGGALRVGLNCGRGRYLGFIDSDGDIPAKVLERFVDEIRSNSPAILAGSKRHSESRVVYPPLRRVYSVGFQILLRMLFRLSVRDTQTGIKLIRRDVVAQVLPLMVEKKFAFDLELFVVAKHLGFDQISELPVVIKERFSSTVSWRSVKGMLLDTLGIYYRLHFIHYYDQGPVREAQVETVYHLDAEMA